VNTTAAVDVRRRRRGGWEVTLPDRRERLRCETLDDARRLGYQCAARRSPCELVVHDAYDRVLQRELIKGRPA
jgi:hypothetical protein